jgi:hypothetical protein
MIYNKMGVTQMGITHTYNINTHLGITTGKLRSGGYSIVFFIMR